MIIRFTRAARKHRVGTGRALEVMANCEPTRSRRSDDTPEYSWYGPDNRGLMISVIAIVVPERTTGEDMLLILHVMPDYN